jgi:ubiquinone/menaquinone biosynthesis C-methylase UbiE
MQTENRFNSHLGTYDDLALEYYDSKLHPTCANFREGSRNLLVPWLRELGRSDARILEVGAGCSIVSEWLTEDKRSVLRFVATDLSPNMLRYSTDHSSHADFVVCDARQLPFADSSFDLIVSSLGDPYNTITFWKELERVLRAGAHALFTTPSFGWARKFRNGDTHAEFVTSIGHTLAVPSYIESKKSQRILIESSGLTFLRVQDIHENQLTSTLRSPKLRAGPIVSGYIAAK